MPIEKKHGRWIWNKWIKVGLKHITTINGLIKQILVAYLEGHGACYISHVLGTSKHVTYDRYCNDSETKMRK